MARAMINIHGYTAAEAKILRASNFRNSGSYSILEQGGFSLFRRADDDDDEAAKFSSCWGGIVIWVLKLPRRRKRGEVHSIN